MKKVFSVLMVLIMLSSFMLPSTHAAAAIKISKSSLTLTIGKTATLKITGTTKAAKWESNKNSVATVSKGKVTAKKAGSATITATVGGKKYTCKVTVKDILKVTVSLYTPLDSLSLFLIGMDKIETAVNDDHTITYTINSSQQQEILMFIKESFDTVISDLPPYYDSVTVNSDFTSFILKVDSAKYNKNKDTDPTNLQLILWGIAYQQFSGIKDEDLKLSIKIIDKKTGKEIETLN